MGEYQKLPLENFIERCNIVHNNKYDYSLVDYVSGRHNIKIICPEHGIFEQIASGHVIGNNCPKCASKRNKTETEIKDFIKSLNLEIIENSRKIIPPVEIDIHRIYDCGLKKYIKTIQ